jgi:colicin import membrane protein
MSIACIVRGLVAAFAVTLAAPGLAGTEDTAAERDRIARERSAAQQRFDAQERACADRFAVTACVDAARRERRESLGRLRREETLLDEAQRKRLAAERMEVIRRKVGQEDLRATSPAARPARSAASAAPAKEAAQSAQSAASDGAPQEHAPLRRGRVRVRNAPAAAAGAAQRSVEEGKHRAEYGTHQRAAQDHVEANRRRNAERASHKVPAAPLPAPASAAAASR